MQLVYSMISFKIILFFIVVHKFQKYSYFSNFYTIFYNVLQEQPTY